MKAIVRKHPVACFIGLTMIISLLIGLPLKLYVLDRLLKNSEIGLSYLSKIMLFYSPAIAAILVTFVTSGRNGLLALLENLKPQGIHIIWWIGLPVAGMSITATAFIAGGFSPAELVTLMISAHPLLLIAHTVAAFFIIGIGEELGWRGWLLPQLAIGRPLWQATLLIFFVLGCWHLPFLGYGYRYILAAMLVLFSTSVLLSWLWDRVSGNLFVMAMAQASLNFPFAFFEGRIGGGQDARIIQALAVSGGIYLVMAIGIFLLERKQFTMVLYPRK